MTHEVFLIRGALVSPNAPVKQYVTSVYQPRPTCYGCFRPQPLCYCEHLRPVDNRTRIVIVQHPREQFHPLNTVRILERSLRLVEVIRKMPALVSQELQKRLRDDSAAILFPSADAEDLETLPAEKRPQEIIVLDGTWHHAKTLLRDVPELQSYRRVRFTPERPSEYRIRKEPQADYLSTLESVAYVLRLQEPDTANIDHLNETFRQMIDQNVQARVPSEEGMRKRTRTRKIPHRFPEALLQSKSTFASIYCEGTSRFSLAQRRSSQVSWDPALKKEPLVVYLHRRGESQPMRWLVKTSVAPPERLLRNLEITQEELAAQAIAPAEVAQQIRRQIAPRETPVVWNTSSQEMLEELGVVAPALVLKGAYCDYEIYRGRRPGSPLNKDTLALRSWGGLDQILARHEIPFDPPQGGGRGVLRAMQTSALLGWICAEARRHCQTFKS